MKYESELKTQFVIFDVSTNHNLGQPRSLHFKFCQLIYLFKTFIMFSRVFIYLVGYLVNLSKILVKLAISLEHNIIFAKFLAILLDNNITFITYTYFVDQPKIIRKSFQFMFSKFLLEAISHQIVFKNARQKFNVPRFQVINEINRNHQAL